ncbi:uncharacterized protein LOC124704713 [Lolium rigidum]|uniref:uncharacterized protein LOC124704713 n=1 Tax=Lolium rigidum TaxID=89674 RepID=UPI001F5DF2CA|nr:uncharacterized protein LOC124704713 [Lolium rigidum]
MKKGDEPSSMGGQDKSSSAAISYLPKTSDVPPKQAHAASLPVLRVGAINVPYSNVLFRSERKVINIVPRRLWGDYAEDDEDSLPSPLPSLKQSGIEVLVDSTTMAVKNDTTTIDNISASVRPQSEVRTGRLFMKELETFSAAPNNAQAKERLRDDSAAEVQQMDERADSGARTPAPLSDVSPMRNVSTFSASGGSHGAYGAEPVSALPSDDTNIMSNAAQSKAAKMPGMVSKSVGTGVYLGARYSMEDVVNFGGIPAKAAEVRSSERIRLQPNADAPQMERAQTLTQAKKAGSISGYPFSYSLDPYVVLSPARRGAPCYGYWVQPTGNGSTGFLQPVRLAC